MSWDRDWSVETWLQSLGLATYSESFLDNGYDLQELCANIKIEDLDAIGVQDERDRARIFSEASKLGDDARARFKKTKGGGSSGSTDHSGSLGSHGSFPAYSEPWAEDGTQKHLYTEVWEQQQSPIDATHGGGVGAGGGGGGISPALANLLLSNGGASDKHKVQTFPPSVAAPTKTPRKKPLPLSPTAQVSFTLPAVPAVPPPRTGAGTLNKVQLKLKVLQELQKDRIILSEPPYCKQDGSMEDEKVSELCQIYSERFSLDPIQIMETMRVIHKASDPHVTDETDSSHLALKTQTQLSTCDNYEEPFDVMKDDPFTLKDGGGSGGTHSSPSSPLKKLNKNSALLIPKPSSSSESSPEQRRREGGSPRSSPHVSPATSPKEHKKFGFFKKSKKKQTRSNSLKEGTGKAGKAVLSPGKPTVTDEGTVVTPSSSGGRSSKKRGTAKAHPPLPSLPSPSNTSPGSNKHRTVSMSSTSTTASESSPTTTKKIGIIRISQHSPKPQRKAKTVGSGRRGGGGRGSLEVVTLTTSEMSLDGVENSELEGHGGGGGGGGGGGEREEEGKLRGAQSHDNLFSNKIPVDSPATAQRRMVESKKKGGLMRLLTRKTRGRRKKEEVEEGRERGGRSEGPSFMTASISLPDIAGAARGEESKDHTPLTPPPNPFLSQLAGNKKSATAPPKPSRRVRTQQTPSASSPDPSPLLKRKVMQSEGQLLSDRLIPIRDSTTEEQISSWNPVSPSHLLLSPERVFDLESGPNSQRESVSSYHSAASDIALVVGSVESHGSSVLGSSNSETGSLNVKKTSSSGSVKKPLPPPKPKSLERGKSTERMILQKTTSLVGGSKKEGGDSDRALPPKKPPRRSIKKQPLKETEAGKEGKGGEREEMSSIVAARRREGAGGGGGGGGGGGERAFPPPKPARRQRSVHSIGSDKDLIATAVRKTQTLKPRPLSSSSSTPFSTTSSISSSSSEALSRRPAPKPRSSSPAPKQTSNPAVSLSDSISSKLVEEGINLTVSPYSTMWGLWGVPALLVSRYGQELDQPPQQIALKLDELRIQSLKHKNREFIPIKITDSLKHTTISRDSISSFLTSIGLPMYSSMFITARGFTNLASLGQVTDEKLAELGIAPNHRSILMKQIALIL